MRIGLSLIPRFEELYNTYAEDPVGIELLKIEGISPDKLDIGVISHNFFENKLADIAIDANSNIVDSGINPTTFRTFTTDGQMKLLGYHMLWYYSAKRYGEDWADKAIRAIWDGDIYFHDAHGLKIQMPYCFAFSLDKLVLEGRPYGTSPNSPPKHRKSFVSQVDKLISDMSKQFAGATAPSDFFLWYAYFCKQEGLDLEYEPHVKKIIQDFQGLVCLFNDASRSEGESPFTNISIYDMTGLHSLFDHITYPDWSKPDLDYITGLQNLFCDWFKEGDPLTGFPYRFPVVTQNLTTDDNGDFIHPEYAKECVARYNLNKSNFNLHFGKHGKLAMCCYSDDTEVLTSSGWKMFKDIDGSENFATVNVDTKSVEYQRATHKHQYRYVGDMHHYSDKKRMFDMMVTPNHEMLCVGGTGVGKRDKWKFVKSEDLGTSHALIRRNEMFDGDCDDFGKLVGFYLGDGYYDTANDVVSFNLKKDRKIEYLLNVLRSVGADYTVGNCDNHGMTRINVYNDMLHDIAVTVGKSHDKHVPYDMDKISIEMIAGLVDGLMNSDGNWDSNRFWTTSTQLRDDFMHMACVLGYQPWYTQFDRNVELRGKEYVNSTFEIKLLTVSMFTHAQSKRTNVKYDGDVFCVDVPNHTLFVRRNGVASLSSNCRYENDLSDMEVTPDSFGNGGVNIGSHRVVTPNFGRAALLADGDVARYYQILDGYFDIAAKLLDVHRNEILQHRIDKNPDYLTFFGRLKWFSLKTMFSTFGVEGIYEAVKFMGEDILEESGTEMALDMMAYVKSKCKQYRQEYGVTFNAEEIPGEQACVSLLKKDKIMINTDMLNPEVAEDFANVNLYSNQYIPLISDVDMITRIDLSGRFMRMISGGGIVHVNVDSPIDTVGKMYEIMRFAAKSGVPHMAICYRYGKCATHKATVIGQGHASDYKCPICGEPVMHTRARVIGYFSDEFNWHPVRREHDAPYRHYGGKEEMESFEEE